MNTSVPSQGTDDLVFLIEMIYVHVALSSVIHLHAML